MRGDWDVRQQQPPRPVPRRQPARITDRSRLMRLTPQQHSESQPQFAATIKQPGLIISEIAVVKPQPYSQPAQRKQRPSRVLSRQTVAAPEPELAPMLQPQMAKRRRSKLQVVLVTMACLIFGLGLLINVQTLQTNHNAKAQVAALAQKSTHSTSDTADVPSESRPNTSKPYNVAPNLAKYLRISKLGVNARVSPLGVTSDGALKAPSNIYDTGWYDASARPGDAGSNGAILIDGHVHGPTLPGVFTDIKKLASGDLIQIVRGDDQVFTYKVVRVQNYDAQTLDMGMMLTSAQPGQPGLNLITCGGPYDHNSGEYAQRTAVFAVQI